MGDNTHPLHISQNQNALDPAFPTQWFQTNLFADIYIFEHKVLVHKRKMQIVV
jgi:hypothetical protein